VVEAFEIANASAGVALTLLWTEELVGQTRGERTCHMAPQILEDEHGTYTLGQRSDWWGVFGVEHYRQYLAGEFEGRQIDITDEQYQEDTEEGAALWGTFEDGEVVPGMLSPFPPSSCEQIPLVDTGLDGTQTSSSPPVL
jgi:hypothetical protein